MGGIIMYELPKLPYLFQDLEPYIDTHTMGLHYYKHQLGYLNKLNDLLNTYYSGISRGIITKSGTGVNGIYNQNLSPNCILIEVGGNENTIEEVYNTIEVLADILNKYISGAAK